WLPLLIAFIWLAWLGKKEYDQVENYRHWAAGFDRAKYDIYAVLGQKDKLLTWGKPSRKAIIDLQTFSLEQVQQINLLVDSQTVDLDIDLEKLPDRGKDIYLEFIFSEPSPVIKIPFTEVPLASQWCQFLRSQLSQP
ncbi:MAG: hypothetical protein HC916_05685, partial [Coleofasciculaceae cyanobacterium SM2_1_6]|nr:hypothetical protein [Coleofasciculaceae cyanobacterium SM2_1_6]